MGWTHDKKERRGEQKGMGEDAIARLSSAVCMCVRARACDESRGKGRVSEDGKRHKRGQW